MVHCLNLLNYACVKLPYIDMYRIPYQRSADLRTSKRLRTIETYITDYIGTYTSAWAFVCLFFHAIIALH